LPALRPFRRSRRRRDQRPSLRRSPDARRKSAPGAIERKRGRRGGSGARQRGRGVLAVQGAPVAVIVTGGALPTDADSVLRPAVGPKVHFALTSPNAFVNADCGVITPAPAVI
jgi:hypothetical protein